MAWMKSLRPGGGTEERKASPYEPLDGGDDLPCGELCTMGVRSARPFMGRAALFLRVLGRFHSVGIAVAAVSGGDYGRPPDEAGPWRRYIWRKTTALIAGCTLSAAYDTAAASAARAADWGVPEDATAFAYGYAKIANYLSKWSGFVDQREMPMLIRLRAKYLARLDGMAGPIAQSIGTGRLEALIREASDIV